MRQRAEKKIYSEHRGERCCSLASEASLENAPGCTLEAGRVCLVSRHQGDHLQELKRLDEEGWLSALVLYLPG